MAGADFTPMASVVLLLSTELSSSAKSCQCENQYYQWFDIKTGEYAAP